MLAYSLKPRWLNRKWRAGSRTTSCDAGHDGSASSGSSNSFSIQAENRFSVARFQVLRNGQVLPPAEPGPPGLSARTLISRVIGPHPAPACWGVSVACQEPAAGALISVNQKYRSEERRVGKARG